MGDRNAGLYNKFTVQRTDGKSGEGQKHESCEYFVLDLTHDEFAAPALRAYAMACRHEYPKLSHDLLVIVSNMEQRQHAKIQATTR